MEIFAGAAMALYTAHHVGDYWVQTHHQAVHKGDAGPDGRLACLAHVLTYLLTQATFLAVLAAVTGWHWNFWPFIAALALSGVTHYAADRREHGALFWLAKRMPWKRGFLELGQPRRGNILAHLDEDPTMERVALDAPQLATGAWALDQAWHIFWGAFVAALVLSL